jgi:hypothetical protein
VGRIPERGTIKFGVRNCKQGITPYNVTAGTPKHRIVLKMNNGSDAVTEWFFADD